MFQPKGRLSQVEKTGLDVGRKAVDSKPSEQGQVMGGQEEETGDNAMVLMAIMMIAVNIHSDQGY
jgi:hypothetical protein